MLEDAVFPRRRGLCEVSWCNIRCDIVSVRRASGGRRAMQQGDGATERQALYTTPLLLDWTGEKITDTALDSARPRLRLPWRRRNWTLAYTSHTCMVHIHGFSALLLVVLTAFSSAITALVVVLLTSRVQSQFAVIARRCVIAPLLWYLFVVIMKRQRLIQVYCDSEV